MLEMSDITRNKVLHFPRINLIIILLFSSLVYLNSVVSQHLKPLHPIRSTHQNDNTKGSPRSVKQQESSYIQSVEGSMPCGSQLLTVSKGDGESDTYLLERPNELRVIVQFRNLPLSRVSSMTNSKKLSVPSIQSALSALKAEHAQFRSDLAMIEGITQSSTQTQSLVTETKILAEYQTAFNGMVMTTTRSVLKQIQQLPYIVGVWQDDTVRTCDVYSNNQIGAPAFWDSTGVHGDSIDIGIIDTGIDYLHPALGGALFPNSKVIGGYDFVNDDTDPMDDNGHGTHVAGIAAGDGPPPCNVRGVAYKARLWAFKVVGADGSGWTSWIISGVERSLDPDNNPSTPTPIKVINLSLGGPGIPNGPLSQAVDNATASGILCVVAAGNSGPNYMTISSPGCAWSALTVSAVQRDGSIPDFSSRGPVWYDWTIKPDLVAPGVYILSAKLGGDCVLHDGTSMAAPHVAGAAALLRQLHPDWSPEEIKAVLVQTTKPTNPGTDDVYTQGSGQLYLPDAVSRSALLTPTALYFGIDDLLANEVWTTSLPITLRNHGSSAAPFTLSTGIPSIIGVTLSFNPSAGTIPAHDSVVVNVALKVRNTGIRYKDVWSEKADQPNYTGRILVNFSNPSFTVQVPFAFTRTYMLRIAMDETPWWLGIIDARYMNVMNMWEVYDSYFPKIDFVLNVFCSPGKYHVFGSYDDMRTKIFKEDIEVSGVTTIYVNKSDAKNRIVIRRLDENGQPVPFSSPQEITSYPWGWSELLIDTATGYGWRTTCSYSLCQPDSTIDTMDFPDVSPKWRYDMMMGAMHNDRFYAFCYDMPHGITSSTTLVNVPEKFQKVEYVFCPDQNVDSLVHIRPWMVHKGNGVLFPAIELKPPFRLNAFYILSPLSFDTIRYSMNVYQYQSLPPKGYYSLRYYMPLVAVPSPNKLYFYDPESWGYLFSIESIPLQFKVGYGAPHWTGETINTPTAIRLRPGSVALLFRGPIWRASFLHTISYKIYHLDTLIASGIHPRENAPDYFVYTNITPPSRYTLEIPYGAYKIADVWGTATAQLECNLDRVDPNPPTLKNLFVLSNGCVTDILHAGEKMEIRFEAKDDLGIDSARLYLVPTSGGMWSEIPLSRDSNRFAADIPIDINDGFVSMRLRLTDPSGNALDYRVEPAFVYNRAVPQIPMLMFPPDSAAEVPNILTFRWKRSVGGNMYRIQVADDSGFTNLFVDDSTLISTSQKIGPLQWATTYFWRVSASNSLGSSSYSETRRFSTAESFSYLPVKLNWNLVSLPLDASSYFKDYISPVISDVFAYNGSSYESKDTLKQGIGYWLKFSSNDTVVVGGRVILSDTIVVNDGWNLIGSISTPIEVTSINSEPSGMVTSDFFGYNSSYIRTDTIYPGHGYWVKTNQSGSLILSSGSSKRLLTRIKIISTSDLPPPPPGDKVAAINNIIPKEFTLYQNYPNPFNPTTTIRYQLPIDSRVTFKIYNIFGQEVRTLIDEIQEAGFKSVEWNANNYSSGVYFYRLTINAEGKSFVAVKKLLLMK